MFLVDFIAFQFLIDLRILHAKWNSNHAGDWTCVNLCVGTTESLSAFAKLTSANIFIILFLLKLLFLLVVSLLPSVSVGHSC